MANRDKVYVVKETYGYSNQDPTEGPDVTLLCGFTKETEAKNYIKKWLRNV